MNLGSLNRLMLGAVKIAKPSSQIQGFKSIHSTQIQSFKSAHSSQIHSFKSTHSFQKPDCKIK